MATKETVRVITRGERVRGRRGRTAKILPDVVRELGSVSLDGETGAVVTGFGPEADTAKRGAIATKIRTHWASMHGCSVKELGDEGKAPKLEFDWIPGENLPQVFAKV